MTKILSQTERNILSDWLEENWDRVAEWRMEQGLTEDKLRCFIEGLKDPSLTEARVDLLEDQIGIGLYDSLGVINYASAGFLPTFCPISFEERP